VAVLDGYGVDRAHLVGMSGGGAVAQLVALQRPERVATVTAISTTFVAGGPGGLPGPSVAYLEHATAWEGLDWSDTQSLGELLVSEARVLTGDRPFDEAAVRELVANDLARTQRPASLRNHGLAGGSGEPPRPVRDIDAPLLVIHGSADPLFPLEHGEALAAAVPGARLVIIDGGGHELHEADWDRIAEAIADHTAANPR
jgi:pimeloyl-ACP methyl ester carboxylesterase